MQPPGPATQGIIRIAILAVGGQGGGVLTDWIVTLAERNGHRAQATSVAGVAQRTGATIYYIELAADHGREPVFALAPSAGDVDIVIAAELMEAGRAILRGFVQPDRTTLITSTHRALAVSEKIVPGDGLASSDKVLEAAKRSSKRLIAFDMERLAAEAGTVISASLMGALAACGELPFEPAAFERVVADSRRGAAASLEAFHAARNTVLEGATEAGRETPKSSSRAAPSGPPGLLEKWRSLALRIDALPTPVRAMALAGTTKAVDFQDLDYGAEYLDRLESMVSSDREHGGEAHAHAFGIACARHLANAMAYDDIIRVADLKTRRSRFSRIDAEVGAEDSKPVRITEFLHPRAEEFCGLLPAPLGRWFEARPARLRLLDRLVNRSRRVKTDTIWGFSTLYAVSALAPWRRHLRRHQVEHAFLRTWLELALAKLPHNYDLAVEIVSCRRLIKGYSDTHIRGQSRYAQVVGALPRLENRPDAAERFRALVDAALADHKGETLQRLLELQAAES